MGLVDYLESDSDSDYSESESGSKAPTQPTPTPAATATATATTTATTPAGTAKKPFQKVVDRSNPGKIRVNLPQTQQHEVPSSASDEPPAKRARTGAGGGGVFSGFNSFLPPPKNASKPATAHSKAGSGKAGDNSSRPAFQLKTSSEAGFSRGAPPPPIASADGDKDLPLPGQSAASSSGLSLPPPKASAQPSIPEGMKAEEDVKLIGKPMMFKPLSVARNNKKKPAKKPPAATPAPAPAPAAVPANAAATKPDGNNSSPGPANAPPKKVSLFSFTADTDADADPATDDTWSSKAAGASYEPLFEAQPTANPYDSYASAVDPSAHANANYPAPTTAPNNGADSLESIANEMNLSASERRELFGRGKTGAPAGAPNMTASHVINFNTDREYQHNQELRASGEQQIHNPVRSIMPGKHNIKQLVNAVQNQKDALEDSFAKGKTNRKEASSKYGW